MYQQFSNLNNLELLTSNQTIDYKKEIKIIEIQFANNKVPPNYNFDRRGRTFHYVFFLHILIIHLVH